MVMRMEHERAPWTQLDAAANDDHTPTVHAERTREAITGTINANEADAKTVRNLVRVDSVELQIES